MRRTIPSILSNPSLPETQPSQGRSSDLSLRLLLSFLPDFLSQKQLELLDNREMHIRLKQMNTTQQMIISRITALEALQRDVSTRQSSFADTLATLESRQTEIENDYSTIQTVLSSIRQNVSELQCVSDSTNRCERELSELSTELQMFRLTSESVQTAQSDGAAVVESRISRLTDVSDDSVVRIDNVEAAIVDLKSEVAALRSSSQDSHQLSVEVGELRSAVSQFKDRVR
jgi:prefoldin subunit 5